MRISSFKNLGLFWFALVFPIPSLVISHFMLSWEERGVENAGEVAKLNIGAALVILSLRVILVCIVIPLSIWALVPSDYNLITILAPSIGRLKVAFGF